ncbi:MAG: RsmB/NOP family class I SAM-dependent RNA methyltransferase, partial [Pyrobaculum sp.]
MNFYGIEIDEETYRHLREYLADGEIDQLFKSLTTPPTRYYIRVNTSKITPGELIKRLNSKGITVYRDEHFEDALWLPVLGPFKIPTAKKVVVVDKKAAESVMLGADLYAPGVLKTDHIRQGEEVNVVADNGIVVAYGVALVSSEDILKTRRGIYIKVEKSLYKTPKLRNLAEYEEGLFYSQSLPAIAVGHVVKKLGTRTAVDFNAAPGGKTTHLAQMGLRVYAVDRSWPKINKLKREACRLGLENCIDIFLHDSRFIDRDFPKLRAEVALVDPPCTDLGVRPKLYHRVSFKNIKTLSRYQIQFLKTALKISPFVIYSTCTITALENESVVEKSGAEVLETGLPVGAPGWGCDNCKRFLPHLHDTPG